MVLYLDYGSLWQNEMVFLSRLIFEKSYFKPLIIIDNPGLGDKRKIHGIRILI